MRLNTFTIAYLKELPVEHFSEILYDIVVNEINNNYEEQEEIVSSLDELLQVNYNVYQFMLEINNGGLLSFLYSDHAVFYREIIDALYKIEADETHSLVLESINFITNELSLNDEEFILALRSQTLYELENNDIIIELKDIDYQIKENQEPVADFLVKFIQEEIKGRPDDDEI